MKGYAHCRDTRCPGNQQQEVDAVRQEMSFTFGDGGGDGVWKNLVERSTIEFRFADESDAGCPVCKRPREVTGTPRPQYQPLSGFDPMGLLSVPKFDAGNVPSADDRTAVLEQQLQEMREQLAKLAGAKE